MERLLAVPRLIGQRAERDSDAALIEVVDGATWTNAEFHTTALRWADGLAALGVRRDDLVASMLPTSVTSYLCWIGLSWLRAPEVPINTDYRGTILTYTLNNAQARVLVIAERFLDRLEFVAADLEWLETVVVPDATGPLPPLPWRVITGDEFLAGARPVPHETPEYFDTHAVIYTSGTTGPSKGVLQPWGCIQQVAEGVFPGDRPGEYDDGAVFTCWPTFHSSGKFGLCLAAQLDLRMVLRDSFSLSRFWDDIRHHRVTHAMLLVIGGLLLRQPATPADADNPMIRAGMYPLIPQYREFERRFGVRLSAGFGNTEVCFATTTADPVNHRTGGRPLAGCEVRIVNEFDEPVGPNTLGEIVVRHDLPWRLNKGYLRMPEATAAAWRNGWFHTGDAGMLDEHGELYFVDRIKDCLRHRGHNVSSAEVEAEVLAHPAAVECACVGVRSEHAHDDDPVPDQDVKVFVVPAPGGAVHPRELFDFLVPRMPAFMLPRYIEVVDALPKTPTNKVRKVELRDRPAVAAATWDREREQAAAGR
jgi:crotonobetaine/carnitine-CoA ligase